MLAYIKKIKSKLAQKVISGLDISASMHKNRGYNDISIVTYHNILAKEPQLNDNCFVHLKNFAEQMAYLAQNFEVLPLKEAFNKTTKIDKPIAAITFDDGFYSNYTLAFPVLQKLKLPATIFLTTNIIDSHYSVWFCDLIYMISTTNKDTLLWENKEFDLSTNKAKLATSNQLQATLKERSHPLLIEAITKIANLLECKYPIKHDISSPYFMLNQSAITQMVQSGLIEFGAHTHNHTILSKLDDKLAREEITTSIKRVATVTQKDCKLFAYPNGRTSDFTNTHLDILKSSQIALAASTVSGLSSSDDNMLAFKRLFINRNTDLSTFKLQVHGYRE